MSTPPPATAGQLIFGREPAAWLGILQAAIALLTSFGLPLTTEQQGAIMAIVAAVLGVVLAWRVRPIAVAAFTTLVQAGVALLVAFGLDLTIEQQGVVLTVSAILLNLIIARPQVTPSPGWLLGELLALNEQVSQARHRREVD